MSENEPKKQPENPEEPPKRRTSSDGSHTKRRRPSSDPAHKKTAPSGTRRKRRRRKKKKSALKPVLIVLAVLLVLAAIGIFLFLRLYNKMNYVPLGSGSEPTATAQATPAEATPEAATPAPTDTPEPTPSPTPTEEELQAKAEQELIETLQEDAEEIMYNENVYNLLLIGSDGTASIMERSDSLILLSINKETKQIWLTSLMRDTKVYIPNIGYGHLNWTASPTNYGGQGGVELLIKCVESEKNYAIHVDNYAQVNFLSFAEIAGMLGPIKVTISSDEAQSMNGLIRQVARMRDEALNLGEGEGTPRVYFPRKGGTFEITDGIQILAYCRERYAGAKGEADVTRYGDTGRSNKQREVLQLMWENVKKMNILQQYALAEKVMSIVTTDLTKGKCASLLLQAPAILTYELGQQQSPHPYAMSKGMDNGASTYFPDWRVNRNILRATIYGESMMAADLTSSQTGNRVTIELPYPANKNNG